MKKNDFIWGVATAAHQIEGGWLEGGKGLNIWDVFSHTPGKIANNDTSAVACDHYHRYEEDIALMAQLGVSGYRFSIAWSRILPQGKGAVNAEGVDFYNRLIDGLLAKGITPFITLYHWDLPLTLQLEHDGWLSYATTEAFAEYADVCFKAFGDRVKHWMTFNENWCTAVLGHGIGVFAPGRVSRTEPYIAAHNLCLAHGLAAQKFRQGDYGVIGIANNCDFREPLTDKPEDQAAAQEALEFFYGWLTDPVVFGDYPAIMRERVGERLPKFTAEQSAMLKGSCDFLGLNHYTTHYASREKPDASVLVGGSEGNGGIDEDQKVFLSKDPDWVKTSMGWFVVPWGIRKMLGWVANRYQCLPIYVTENGCSVNDNDPSTAQHDSFRADFVRGYTDAVKQARDEDGVDVRGYFYWSLIDNFEWTRGYDMRFGLIFCNFDTQERIPKESYYAYQDVIRADG